MKGMLLSLSLLACQIAPAWSETQYQITCPGRPTMTVSRAQYGLSTLTWPQHHFQIAAGQQRAHLNDGDHVSVTRFRNGDQLLVNKSSNEIFFVYHDTTQLLPCNRSATRDVDQLSLQPYDDRAHPDS